MENDIICITDHIEIQPNGIRYSVVRDGSVYGTYEALEDAQHVADSLSLDESR